MSRIVLANWKASLAPERALAWCDSFSAAYTPRTGLEVVLAVPALVMDRVHQRLGALAGVSLAAQGISPYPQGSYTGSLPAAWLRDTAKFALIGHRERRQYFHETVQDVARQGYEALAEGLQPIVCVDNDLLTRQAAAFAREELEQLLWAWTPETPVALEMAQRLAEAAPLVLQTIKRATLETLPKSPAEIAYPQMGYLTEIAQSEDYKEGVAAFTEKRKAVFRGK